MAQLFPSLEKIKQFKVKPEPGELHLLEFLQANLPDRYEVYFQPFLNGDNPDIIIMRKDGGVMIIEVKDWRLESYQIDKQGRWQLNYDGTFIKSPISQVEAYKDNLYYLHIDQLLKRKISNKKSFGLVSCIVYFHNETEDSISHFFRAIPRGHTKLIGQDSLTKQKFTNLLSTLSVGIPSRYFDNELYQSFRRYLQPSVHTIEQGIPITYSKKQQALIDSKAKEQRIIGVVGSGKTFVLAKKAVNAYIRTHSRVLILTFNITLRNYIHDRISEVRENFPWDSFYITHYHQFFRSEANNYSLHPSLPDYENTNFFESVKNNTRKYEAIFIDEIQDYEKAWVKIIRKYFLAKDGEFVVFGDEKQNIYHRQLETDGMPYTDNTENWKKLSESYRLRTKAVKLATEYQRYFLNKRYVFDEIQVVQRQLDFGEESIKYEMFNRGTITNQICEVITSQITLFNVHPNDVAIVALSIDFLRELDFTIRNNTNEKTTTAFETKEMYQAITSGGDLRKIGGELKKSRKGMKFNFWANKGTIKLSTIHSFKGWEVDTLFLIIENEHDVTEKDIETEELIYTGITRCRRNLVIINIGNAKYHEFFASAGLQTIV